MKPELETAEVDGICERTKTNGQRCRGMAMEGSRYCYFYNPAAKKARKAAQQQGGRADCFRDMISVSPARFLLDTDGIVKPKQNAGKIRA